MANQKSDYRITVEQALRKMAGTPVSKQQLIEMTGTEDRKVRYVLHKLLRDGLRCKRSGHIFLYWYEQYTPEIGRREPAKPTPFTGVDWSYSTSRPGCQDFLKYPSRRGDNLFPYKEPLLNASSAVTPKGDKK